MNVTYQIRKAKKDGAVWGESYRVYTTLVKTPTTYTVYRKNWERLEEELEKEMPYGPSFSLNKLWKMVGL